MKIAVSKALGSQLKITGDNKAFLERKSRHDSNVELQDRAADIVHFAPLIGAALAHNSVQSFFAQRSIQYFAHPITNYFMNLPIATLAGSVAYAVAKTSFPSEDKKVVSSDFEGIDKAISWATCFNMVAAIGMHKVIMSSLSDPFTRTFFALAGPFVAETSIALGSLILSATVSSLACDMFGDIPKEKKQEIS
ncbi:MAG: hypothetical protein S4CHLAM6_02530 [Chlamydiae bacterium]|nr:hypothetical protein [Chlamydiota bacterium]